MATSVIRVDLSSKDSLPNTSKRVARARERLNQSAWFCGGSDQIVIEDRGDVLVLRGRVPSFYLKQVLQTLLRDVEGVRHIDNQVSVD